MNSVASRRGFVGVTRGCKIKTNFIAIVGKSFLIRLIVFQGSRLQVITIDLSNSSLDML